ncbi:hypothetical protein OAN27_02425 [Pelagibacteraceae bacterium]|nr:hypothetical protein [Pelagibacteraceae bacterium]
MILNLVSMNGFGIFVWLSFAIVIVSCGALYINTKRTLKKYEQEFLKEFETLSVYKKKAVIKNSKIASNILATNSKTN